MADDTLLMKALSLAVDVDVASTKSYVAELRKAHPGKSKAELAAVLFSQASWRAMGQGVLFGLPSNPFVAIPAALADAAAMLRLEVVAAARTALLYDEGFFDEEDAAWELLVPVFGLGAVSQLLREAGVRASMGVTRQLIKRYLSKEALKAFQRAMLRIFGLRVTQRAVITKSLPVVGAVIGGGWNWLELRLLRGRCVGYFEGRAL